MSARSAWISAPMLLLLGSVFPVHSDHFTITGTIVGPDGEAVAGATVQSPYLQTGPPRKYVWATATTADDGAFQLRGEAMPWVKEHVLMASKEGLATGFAKAEPGEEVRIQLGGQPTPLTGTVLDPEGKPLAGVEVAIQWLGFEHRCEGMQFHDSYLVRYPGSPLRAITDQKGRFAIEALPAEARVSMAARGPGLADYECSGRPRPVSEPLTITMYPEARISGRVLRHGEPVPRVRVDASTPEKAEGSVKSEETGYSIGSLPAGTYTVSVIWQDDYVAAPKTDLTVEAGQHLEGVDLELIEGAIIEGRVTLEGSALPAADVGILVTHADAPKHIYGFKTDQEGCYRARVAPGTVYLRLSDHWEGPEAQQKISLEVRNGEHRDGVDFVTRGPVPSCTALVRGPEGAPLRGTQVWLITPGHAYPLPKPQVTNDEGRAPLGPAPTTKWGQPSVFAQHSERKLAGIAPLAREGATTEVRLKPGAYAVVEVLGAEGDPVALGGARASVLADGLNPHGIPVAYRTDEDGTLRIGPLPPGVPLLIGPNAQASAMAVEEWLQFERPTLAPGETLELPPLRLNPGGRTLRGTVVDDQERPAAALVFCMETVILEPVTVKTDDEGRFEMTGLKSRDTVTVIALTADGKRACGMLCDPELPFEPVFVLEPAGVIQGTVYQPDGKPKARAVVHVQCTDVYTRVEPHEGLVLMGNVVADEPGRYRAEGMVPGLMYSISSHDYETGHHGWADQFVASGGPDPMVMEIQLGKGP